jgi:DNA-damage-inducible protein J
MGVKKVNLNIRTNKALKEEVGKILHDLGLNHSIVINMLYHQISILKGIPFPIKIPNKTTQKAFNELESNKNLKTYNNSGELFEELGI